MMALEFMRGENMKNEGSQILSYGQLGVVLESPDQISYFLSLSLWFRTQLLKLIRQHVKDTELFSESELMPLPSCIGSEQINIIIKPHEEKLREIERGTLSHAQWQEIRAKKAKERSASCA